MAKNKAVRHKGLAVILVLVVVVGIFVLFAQTAGAAGPSEKEILTQLCTIYDEYTAYEVTYEQKLDMVSEEDMVLSIEQTAAIFSEYISAIDGTVAQIEQVPPPHDEQLAAFRERFYNHFKIMQYVTGEFVGVIRYLSPVVTVVDGMVAVSEDVTLLMPYAEQVEAFRGLTPPESFKQIHESLGTQLELFIGAVYDIEVAMELQDSVRFEAASELLDITMADTEKTLTDIFTYFTTVSDRMGVTGEGMDKGRATLEAQMETLKDSYHITGGTTL